MLRLNHKMTSGFAAWVGIMAVVFNAVWPLMLQLKPGTAPVRMEARAESGMHHADAAGGCSAPDQSSPLMPHCAFCTLVAGGFAALVADGVITVAAIGTAESRYAFPEARTIASFSYSFAQPRAPPALS